MAVPLLYFATDLSPVPDVWRFSYRDLVQVLASAGAAAAFLLSYRVSLPGWVVAARSVITASLATLLAALIVGEVVLHAVDTMPYRELPNTGRHLYDEEVGHVYRPNFTQTLQTREWRQEWRSNSQGVRADRDFGPKPEGVTRILIIGDSFTVGDQVAVDSTYPGVLQRLLGDRRFEVVNAGVPAYGTVHEARWLAKFGARFEPDVVVLGMTPNDLIENPHPAAVISRDGALVRRGSLKRVPVFEDRQRWYNLRGHFERSMVHRAIENATQASSPYVHRRAFQVTQDSASIAQYELAKRYLLEARDAAHAMGATFAFITIPFLAQFGELGEGLDPTVFGERWGKFATAQEIPYRDVFPEFRAHPAPEALYWVEDGHCTAAGYALIGETLYHLLVEEAETLGLPLKSQ